MKKKKIIRPRVILLILCSAILLCLLMIGIAVIPSLKTDLETKRMETMKQVVLDAAAQCYAVEGVYPESLEYLEEHYGILLNKDKYIVSYECGIANQPPEVRILKK